MSSSFEGSARNGVQVGEIDDAAFDHARLENKHRIRLRIRGQSLGQRHRIRVVVCDGSRTLREHLASFSAGVPLAAIFASVFFTTRYLLFVARIF